MLEKYIDLNITHEMLKYISKSNRKWKKQYKFASFP